MTFNQLLYFVYAYELRSINSASKKLSISQPTISLSIKNLEQELSVELFDRSNNSFQSTAAGDFLYIKAKEILYKVDDLRKDISDYKTNVFTIKIGIGPMIGTILFPQIYKEFHSLNPNFRFEIQESGSLNIKTRVIEKSLDMGMVLLDTNERETYNIHHILKTELVFCVSSQNHLASKKTITVEDIKNEPIILMKEGSFQNPLVNQMYSDAGFKPRVLLYSSQPSVIKNFVSMNAGGAFLVREFITSNDRDVVGIPFEKPIELNIGLIWSKDAKLHKQARMFVEHIIKNTYKI
jgi:DNA-binding transcriptional LysR family regulator